MSRATILRHFIQINNEEYLYTFASCVVDYIPEQHLVAEEIYRILKPGGRYFLNIMPYRMCIPITPRIAVKNFNALAHELYDYSQKQHEGGLTNIPQLNISLSWIVECLNEAGFAVDLCSFWDTFAKRLDFWIEARKPIEAPCKAL